MDLPNLRQQLGLLNVAFARSDPIGPGVPSAAGDPEHAAHHRDRVGDLLRLDQRVSRSRSLGVARPRLFLRSHAPSRACDFLYRGIGASGSSGHSGHPRAIRAIWGVQVGQGRSPATEVTLASAERSRLSLRSTVVRELQPGPSCEHRSARGRFLREAIRRRWRRNPSA